MMPDYFTALVSQYAGAFNAEQSTRYAKAVIEAWYFTLSHADQKVLINLLPDYLQPKKKLFFAKKNQSICPNQYQIFTSRLVVDLVRSSSDEAEFIAHGVFRSLKIISSPEQNFEYSKLFRNRLSAFFIRS
ncbi:hypothetical protein EXS66_01410 [Candidatus Saccharibacteria bacterium]|nr:hypothetical protein [Candidatus Saccharibacteria bacterium]